MPHLRISRLITCLTLMGCLLAVQMANAEAERFALVIGNSEYNGGNFGPLTTPVNDAEAIAATLKKLGFGDNVFLHTNIDKETLFQARIDFEQKLREHPNSVALVYFSGHGLQGSDGKNYLIPLKANIQYHEEVKEKGVGIDDMLEGINADHPQMTIFIVDACRDTVSLPSRQTKGAPIKGTMTPMSAALGSLIAFATSPGQSALTYVNEKDVNSPFTAALLENIVQPGYSIEKVFKETRKSVLQRTSNRQEPAEESKLMGDFYFAKAAPALNNPVPIPAASPKADDLAQTRLKAMEAERLQIENSKGSSDSYFQQQCVKEIGFWQEKADRNNPIAQSFLGGCYFYGHGVSKDYPQAVELYSKAADQGYATAQDYLGDMYFNGKGVPKDNPKALAWYRKAADQGYARAQATLGIMYDNGSGGVARDDTEAVEWYRKAAEQGNSVGQVHLGFMYNRGEGVAKDYTKAEEWYRKAADQGDASAQFNLGQMYKYGEGVDQSDTEAAFWYRKSAESGHEYAKKFLAELTAKK